jgi:hypothetical protein
VLTALQIKNASVWGSGADSGFANNGFFNGSGWRYITTSGAALYQTSSNVHAWYNAPSGTAGNAISFTQAMTLDASGNLLLNETSQAYGSKFTLSYDPASYNGPIVLDSRSYAINRGGATWYGGKYNTAGNYRPYGGIGAKKENATDGNSAGYLAFYTNDNSADATERARIDSSGNLFVGRTSDTNAAGLTLGGDGFIRSNRDGGVSIVANRLTSDGQIVLFRRDGSNVGSIDVTTTGTTLTGTNGITFTATQSASSDANTLDDYEEGTWTPIIVGTTTAGTGTYSSQNGRYTKVGNMVTATSYVEWSAHTGTGAMRLGGLPFATLSATANLGGVAVGYNHNIALTANNVLTAYTLANSTECVVDQYPVGGGASTTVPIDTAGGIVFTVSYLTST